jgi:hypothetical protein
MLQPKFPAVATMLADAREDLTAFCHFPSAHWAKIWSTNPLERVNKEIKRRTDVVGVVPDPERFAAGRGGAGRGPRLLAGGRAGATSQRARWPSSPRPAMTAVDPKQVRRATAELVAG